MLTGIDHLLSLNADHLFGAHGMPISGADEILNRVTKYRDSIQFLWDQTVRLTNRGYTSTELAHQIRLPDFYDDDNLTSEFYGVSEHHVRQIRNGLFGWFDGDPANLFPLPREEHANRMIAGFGGRETVRNIAREAIRNNDLRWACELGSWLSYSSDSETSDRELLASTLRLIAQRTTAANIRNWCLTRARDLDGTLDLSRFNTHRLTRRQIVSASTERSVHILRVMLDPERAIGLDANICFNFTGHEKTGLHIRNCIAKQTDGRDANIQVSSTIEIWADILTGVTSLSDAITLGTLKIDGNLATAKDALAVFDIDGLRS